MLQWFAIHTLSRHENRVNERLLNHNLETFLPLYKAECRWKKSRPVTVDMPLFPGYIFVHIEPNERYKVLGVQGVLSLVGSRREAWPLDKSVIDSLRTGIHLRKVQPCAHLLIGDRVRITGGALVGLEGVLVRKKNNFRVAISLSVIPSSILVEVGEHEVVTVATENLDRKNRATGTKALIVG